ncbi:MAG: hypothetical protein HY512_00180 [Candidatus Aenigmarchaeota archaeon]|nr:hypothetical protein [Candidatus Aenigmarchaeota archaeon]
MKEVEVDFCKVLIESRTARYSDFQRGWANRLSGAAYGIANGVKKYVAGRLVNRDRALDNNAVLSYAREFLVKSLVDRGVIERRAQQKIVRAFPTSSIDVQVAIYFEGIEKDTRRVALESSDGLRHMPTEDFISGVGEYILDDIRERDDGLAA